MRNAGMQECNAGIHQFTCADANAPTHASVKARMQKCKKDRSLHSCIAALAALLHLIGDTPSAACPSSDY
jgi:hypothetical protein